MSRYQTQEASFSIPKEFHDHSMNIFSLGGKEPSECSFLVTRNELKTGEALESHTDKQIEILQKKIPTLRIEQRSHIDVQGKNAISLTLFWTAQGKALVQRQVIVARNQIDILVFTATCELLHQVRWLSVFDELIQSVRWHDAINQA